MGQVKEALGKLQIIHNQAKKRIDQWKVLELLILNNILCMLLITDQYLLIYDLTMDFTISNLLEKISSTKMLKNSSFYCKLYENYAETIHIFSDDKRSGYMIKSISNKARNLSF